MPAPRYINPIQWSIKVEGCGKRRCSTESGELSNGSLGRPPFAIEADRLSPQSTNHPSGGKGKALLLGEEGYAGVKAVRLAEIREVDRLPTGRQKQRGESDGNAVSDVRAAEDLRFFQTEHKVGRRTQPQDQKYSTDPKVREQYRYYIASSGDCSDGCVIPGTKRHASCPPARRKEEPTQPPYMNDGSNADNNHKPSSTCGSHVSQRSSAASEAVRRPRSSTSTRSRSSGRSSAVSVRSSSGYSGIAKPAQRQNPFERGQASICSSRTSTTRSENYHGCSETLSAVSAQNLRNRDKFKYAPSARSRSTTTTSASGWSQVSSESSSGLFSRYSA